MKTTVRVGKNIEKYIKNLEDFSDATDGMLKATIYPGAKVMADEMRKAIEALPELKTSERETKTTKKSVNSKKDTRKRQARAKPSGITRVEREGLLEGLGITGMRYGGSLLNNKVGMDGYNKHVTDKWPKGHPNAMVARSLEAGTSFRKKTPFIGPTARKFRAQAEQAMAKEFDQQVTKNWNGG